MDCQDLVELITDYFDGALSRREARRFERHIAACDGCTTYVEQMRATVSAIGSLPPGSLSPEARRELLAAFRDWRAA